MVSTRNEEHGTIAPAAEHDHRCACGSAEHPSPNQPPESLPDEELLYDLADLFKVFGDTTRIKILYVLFESELCVCDIARLLNLTQSAVSHQLRILKASNLVRFRREGKTVFYALDDDHVRSVLALGMEHVLEK